MSHTPGPWKTVIANYSEDNLSWLASADVVTPRGATLVRFEGTQDYQKNNEHEANASLIAAAPDMLTALEKALPFLIDLAQASDDDSNYREDTNIFRKEIEAIIAKARGES